MAQSRIMYVELKTGYQHNGPATISRVKFSKSGRSVYYKEKLLHRHKGGSWNNGNYFCFDEESEECFYYWVSGPKKNQQDRHQFGFGPVEIDDDVREEYLELIGQE